MTVACRTSSGQCKWGKEAILLTIIVSLMKIPHLSLTCMYVALGSSILSMYNVHGSWLVALGYIVSFTWLSAILSHLHASRLYCPSYMPLGYIVPLTCLLAILSHLHGSRLVAGVYIVPLTWLLACGWCLYCPTYMALGLWLVSILSHLHGSWLVAGVYIVPLTWLLACGWCLYCPTYMALGLWLVSILPHDLLEGHF